MTGAHPRAAPQRAGHHDGEAPGGAHQRGRVVHEEQRHDDGDGGEEVGPLGERGEDSGPRGHGLDAAPDRESVDEEEGPGKEQDRREERHEDDSRIGGVREFRHQERARPHDRRHQLASRGGGGLDAAGFLAGEAEALHHRDGERPGRHGVGDGGTRNRTERRRSHHRRFRRPAPRPAGGGEGEVDEEPAAAGALEQRSEQDEDEHRAARHPDREAEEPRPGEDLETDDPLEFEAAVRQDAGERGAEGVVGEEDDDHRRHHDAHPPAGGFEQQRDQGGAGGQVGGVQPVEDVVDSLPVETDDHDPGGYGKRGQHEIGDAYPPRTGDGAGQKTEGENPGQVDGPHPGGSEGAEDGLPELKQREDRSRQQHRKRERGPGLFRERHAPGGVGRALQGRLPGAPPPRARASS